MHVVIVGNGIAGASAAFKLRDLDSSVRITMVSGESAYHYSRPALMYLFMGHMTWRDVKPYEDHVWAERRIELVRDWAVGIDVEARRLRLRKGGEIAYDALLLATGSVSNKFGWPGQDLPGVQGLYDLFDLRMLEENIRRARRAVIVGGGLIGIELAEMLLARRVPVSFLVRESSFWNVVLPAEESAMVNEVILDHGIDLRLETELDAIHADGDGRAGAVTTKSGDRVDCQLVGLAVGVSPNIRLAKASGVPCNRGVLVDRRLRSAASGIYAAGDCAEIETGSERNLIQQVWYTGRFQGRHAAESILGSEREYDSGIWFNSAKFFDLEYQTYGQAGADPARRGDLFWRHPRKRVAVRLTGEKGRIAGFNVLGTRFRHAVCERWIAERAPIEEVVRRLPEATFDPELFEDFAGQASAHFRREAVR